MKESSFQNPEWYRATTLMERISLFKDRDKEFNFTFDSGVAERRMTRWRSQHPFTKESYFSQRISMAGVKEDEFLNIIGESAHTLYNHVSEQPSWLMEISKAFSRTTSFNDKSFYRKSIIFEQEADGFLEVIQPLIIRGLVQFHEGIKKNQEKSNLFFDISSIEDVFLFNLKPHLLKMIRRTIVLELNISRLQGNLHGNTAEERFKHFIKGLSKVDSALVFLQEYPVLARKLSLFINHFVKFSLEFLTHLCDDREVIVKTFSTNYNPGTLVQWEDLGDQHQGGRSVLLAKFSSGLQIVYKPRSLSIDVNYNKLLHWINKRGDHPHFRTIKVIDRGSYGWVEFIEVENCISEKQIKHFYERQGGYLALLYALQATDFHYENLIAAGEHPVLIDLEALFHPRIGDSELKQAIQYAGKALSSSVLRTGLLPRPTRINNESEPTDFSGLGAKEGQLTPLAVPRWEKIGTDEMRLIHKKVPMMGYMNRPTFEGSSVDLIKYLESIIKGFSSIYRLLLIYRDELLSNDGPLTLFEDDEVRVIFRETQTYATLLDASYHPDVLREALDQDQLFDQLWVSVEHSPFLSKVIGAENKALQNSDIPKFTTRPNSRDIWTCSGERIINFLDKTGLESVRNCIKDLSEEDLEKQLWFIRASIATTSTGIPSEKQFKSYSITSQNFVDRQSLLKAAQAVGDRLERLAHRGELDASWIGLTRTAKENWSLLPLDMDLYDGIPGVALFLAYLGEITADKRYTSLAQAALKTVEDHIKDERNLIKPIGGFNGWGGVIYTLTHLGVLWNKSHLISKANEIVKFLPDLIVQDDQFDIIFGAAGCIGSLLALYRIVPSKKILNTAIQCGDWIVTHATAQERGVGWTNPVFAEKPLTGFSHGVAGIAWALLELAELTGLERFQKTAFSAIDYERSLFSFKEGNWPDLRELVNQNNKEYNFGTTWCHGAPGIGLSRLYILPYLDDNEIYTEIEAAIRTTLTRGFFGNHSLCHGDLGNLELIVKASEKLNSKHLNSCINDIAANILNSIENNGWLCGNPLNVEAPGLMTGIAGIGFGLLRLAEPSRVPSVLMLEPPLKGSDSKYIF